MFKIHSTPLAPSTRRGQGEGRVPASMLWVKGVPVQQFPPPGLHSDLASHRRSSSCRLPYANLSWKEQPRGGERQGSICIRCCRQERRRGAESRRFPPPKELSTLLEQETSWPSQTEQLAPWVPSAKAKAVTKALLVSVGPELPNPPV